MLGLGVTPLSIPMMGQTLIQRAIAVLRRFGSDAHIYLPGVGMLNGLTAGNYLDSALTTPATIDNPVGGVVDAMGGINATQATTASKPILRRGAVNIGFPSSGNAVLGPTRATYVDDGTKITLAGVELVFYKLAEDGTTASSHFGVPSTKPLLATTTYTASYYVKAGGRTRFRLEAISTTNWNPSTPSVTYNLSDRTVSGSNGATGTLTEIESGVFRVTWTATTSATAPTSGIYPVLLDANGSSPYNGDGASGIYITGYQLEVGAAANTYIPTTTAAASSSSGPQYWQFDGLNDSLSLGSVPFQTTEDHFFITAVSPALLDATDRRLIEISGAAVFYLGIGTSGFTANYAGSSLSGMVAHGLGLTAIVGVRRVGNLRELSVNGVVQNSSSDAITTGVNTAATLGNRATGDRAFNGAMYPAIAIRGVVSDSEQLLLRKLIGQISGTQS